MAILPKDYKGIVYQIIRPTGLLDPIVEVRPSLPETFSNLKKDLEKNGYTDMPLYNASDWTQPQVPNLIDEIQATIKKKQRVLVTTLTKRMSEELSDYLTEKGIKAKYLHSDIDSLERVKILKELRLGQYDVLVGINLLREGLDLPEVSLVAILDADKEGFLRSQTSLIQVIGRAARHSEGRVIMYADKITDSMKFAIDETRRRRAIQDKFNKEHGITPTTVVKEIKDQLSAFAGGSESEHEAAEEQNLLAKAESFKAMNKSEQKKFLKEIKFQMQLYADMLEFEKAAELRDIVTELER
ncbi:UvrB/UvrC motif-containing protein [Candidatus Dojkabacteria bacterium]|nr:UvrB/UvrC motif-containing protein [Candidatus Dojkabacteria bacterium]